jgi:hypothetical protein
MNQENQGVCDRREDLFIDSMTVHGGAFEEKSTFSF